MYSYPSHDWEILDIPDYGIQNAMDNPIAFSASTDPDTMHLHEAQRATDWPQFKKEMKREVSSHETLKHWEMVPRSQFPKNLDILPAVWSMKCKRRIATGEVYRWKARLSVHGGKQTHGVNFWETYSPVVSWFSIRLFLVLALLNKNQPHKTDRFRSSISTSRCGM